MVTVDESGQMALAIDEEELDFALRVVPLAEIAHIETPIPPKRELVESIRMIGMLQPPIFREDADGHLDIVVGRRRLAAARLAGVESVRIFVARTSAALADVMTLAENAIRSANTVTEFDAIERLTKQGFDIRSIRILTGMAVGTIKKRQGLLRLTPELAEAFRAGKMTATVADGAAKQPVAVQKELAMALVAKGRITANDLHEVRQARTQASMQTALFDDLDDDAGEDADAAPGDPADIGSVEYGLAVDLQAAIDRMPAAYDAWIAELRAIATGLMAIATGQGGAPDARREEEKVDEGRYTHAAPSARDTATYLIGYTWQDADGNEIVREIDPKYTDAPVARPDRVFTLSPIVEATVGTDDPPKGSPSRPKPRKPRSAKKETIEQLKEDIDSGRVKPLDEEDEFIAGLFR
jgi:ParB/RepB/Spo0J family partition protein